MNFSHKHLVNIIDLFTIFEVSHACLLVFVLVVMKRNKRANIFFALFIVFLSLNFLSMFLHANRYEPLARILMFFAVPGISIIGVLIYFYTSLMTGFIEKFRVRHLSHFSIFLILFVLLLIGWFMHFSGPVKPKPVKPVLLVLMGSGLVNSLVYIIISFIRLRKYYSKINNYFADIRKYNMSWLTKLTSLSLLFFIIWNVDFWLSHLSIIHRNPYWILMNIGLLTVIIYTSAYYLINKPDTYSETKEMLYELENENKQIEKEKYAKQSIDEVMKHSNLTVLKKYMMKKKPYLNESLTIKDLADEIGIPTHHLSIVINDVLNMNFYTFVNEYRVNEAIKILEDPVNMKANILSIAYSSGFNSKSTFNNVFKKITGQTPTEYRNSLKEKSDLAS